MAERFATPGRDAISLPADRGRLGAMRVKTKALQGEAVRWDGTNAGELAELAGDRFEGTHASSALVRGTDGELIHVRPGWVVSRWDGRDGVTVSSAGAFEVWAEEAA